MVRKTLEKENGETTMDKTGAKNLQQLKKISMAILKLVKESYKLSMKRIRYVLSLNYEEEIEKIFSMLDIDMIKEALEQQILIFKECRKQI